MSDSAIVLFDGTCNFCDASVKLILANDPAGHFRFAALQSDAGRAALARAGVVAPADGTGGSIVLLEAGRVSTRSDAALRIATSLRFPWPLLGALFAVPQGVRDGVYDVVARSRYALFGRRAECRIPTEAERARFL